MTNPQLITTPFAENGTKNTIPESGSAEPQLATMQAGFPEITQRPINEGGIPPERADFNGILNLYGQHLVHLNKGLPYEFDQDFANSIGGYPLNARIMLSSGEVVQNTQEGNTNNPNTNMGGWKSSAVSKDVTVPTYKTAADGVNPVTGVADGAYFNVRSEDDDTVAIEYQNVGGVGVATGKSYPSWKVFSKLRDEHVTVDTISDLRSIPASRVQDIKSVTVLGYYSKGDGGAGPRRIWKAGPFVDNGGSVIIASGGGAWVFDSNDPVHIKAFGAVGVIGSDDTAAFANAFASGIPVFSDDSCYHEIQRVVISSVIDKPYFNYMHVSSTLAISFDGKGCVIKGKSMIGESYPYPKNGTGLAGDAWCWIFDFSHIKIVNVKNINITGALFDNIQEDTKPYIYGVQGTYMALNTMLSGIICYSVGAVDLSNIFIEKVAKGLRVYRTNRPSIKNILISKVNDAFQFTDTTNGAYENLHSFQAKYNLAETRDGVYSSKGNIVDINGNTIYTIVPDTSNNSGIKVAGGHAFIEAGGQGNTYINCTDYDSVSDGFRTQNGVLYAKPKNIKTINHTSEFARRWALSMYSDGEDIQHINPTITNHGKLTNYVEPPATREEALQGCTDGDIENYWIFNQNSNTSSIAAIRSAYSGMYIEGVKSKSGGRPSYTGDRFLETTLHTSAYHSFLLCASTNIGHKTEINGGSVDHIKSGQLSPVFRNISGSTPSDLSTGLLISNGVNYTVESFVDNDAIISTPSSTDRAVLVGLDGCSLDFVIQGGSITSRYISGYNSPTTSGVFGGKIVLNRVVVNGIGFFVNTNKAQPNNLIDANYNAVLFNSKPLLGRVLSGSFQKTTMYECTRLVETLSLTDSLNDLSKVKQTFNGVRSYIFNVTTSGVIFNVPQKCALQSITPLNRAFPDTIPSSSQSRYDQIGYYAVTNKFITSSKLGLGDVKLCEIMNSSGVYHELRYSVVSVLDDGTMDISIKCSQLSIAGLIKIEIDPISLL